jgi:hypothetical protein
MQNSFRSMPDARERYPALLSSSPAHIPHARTLNILTTPDMLTHACTPAGGGNKSRSDDAHACMNTWGGGELERGGAGRNPLEVTLCGLS